MKRWRVGDVHRLGAGGGAGETWGVALYDETGKPCVTFGYPKETDAKAGREHIKAALIGVASVTKAQGTTVDRIRPRPLITRHVVAAYPAGGVHRALPADEGPASAVGTSLAS